MYVCFYQMKDSQCISANSEYLSDFGKKIKHKPLHYKKANHHMQFIYKKEKIIMNIFWTDYCYVFLTGPQWVQYSCLHVKKHSVYL